MAVCLERLEPVVNRSFSLPGCFKLYLEVTLEALFQLLLELLWTSALRSHINRARTWPLQPVKSNKTSFLHAFKKGRSDH